MEVNLRKLYPTLYSADVFVEVSDEVFEAIRAFERWLERMGIMADGRLTDRAGDPTIFTGGR